MPKKSRLNVELADHQQREHFLPPVYLEYTPEERGELRKFFESPLWKKTLSNVRTARPPLFVGGTETPLGNQIANNRLHQLQGWQLFEVALARSILPEPPKRKQLTESYPDAGRPDFEKSKTS